MFGANFGVSDNRDARFNLTKVGTELELSNRLILPKIIHTREGRMSVFFTWETAMTYLITSHSPERWKELEALVAAILAECGMAVEVQAHIDHPRGGVEIDVRAVETASGIQSVILCECKNWKTKIPQGVVQSFRTVMHDAGAHRGYIVSKMGFQAGAIKTAHATNIQLVTFEEFQELYFAKWIEKRRWDIDRQVGSIFSYYEFGIPGIDEVAEKSEAAAAEYCAIHKHYQFVPYLLVPFSPYFARQAPDRRLPALPIDAQDNHGYHIPDDLRAATGYREYLALLQDYAREALIALHACNPIWQRLAEPTRV